MERERERQLLQHPPFESLCIPPPLFSPPPSSSSFPPSAENVVVGCFNGGRPYEDHDPSTYAPPSIKQSRRQVCVCVSLSFSAPVSLYLSFFPSPLPSSLFLALPLSLSTFFQGATGRQEESQSSRDKTAEQIVVIARERIRQSDTSNDRPTDRQRERQRQV